MLVVIYLLSITIANLTITWLGPLSVIPVAFLLIGLDLTIRDYLHEQWNNQYLWIKMLVLIGTGSLLSWSLNAGPIALASFIAFASAGMVDTIAYWLLGNKSHLLKVNGSNVISAAVDSLLFPVLAFGFPVFWWIIIGQFLAKTLGGFVWFTIIRKKEIS